MYAFTLIFAPWPSSAVRWEFNNMSAVTTVQVAPVIAPRGAQWAAQAAVAFADALQRLFARRAAMPLSPAEEAEALRRYAMNFRATDPGFASDLMAAADRHELQSQ
jgi:hypothetical protein